MKNPIVSAAIVTAVFLVVILGVVQFVVGPSSAKSKERLLNGYLANFNSAEGKILAEATPDEALQAVCAGKASPSVTIPQGYAPRGISLSPCYDLKYNPASDTFQVSFSIIRFFTDKPYLASSAASL